MTLTTASPDPAADQMPALADVEGFLAALITDLAPAPGAPRPGRPRTMPALALWGGVLVCVLRGWGSQRAVWRLLSLHGLWEYPRMPITDQAVYTRLAAGGTHTLEAIFARVRELLAARRAPDATLAPFASGVYALDQTALDPVARLLPPLRPLPDGDPGLLPGKLNAVFDLRRQLWHRVAYTADARENERVAAPEMVADLPLGSLVIADLGYFGFRWFDELTDAGYAWLSRLTTTTSMTRLHTFYADGETVDALVWLGKHRSDQAKHVVRYVQFRQGTTLYRYLTNVRDPRSFSLRQMAETYARRWDIDSAFDLAKRHLGLHAFWSAKPIVLQQQVWAVLIITQIIHALRGEIAERAGVDLMDVSLPLVITYLPRLLAEGKDAIALIVAHGRQTELIRPSRRTRIITPTIPIDQLVDPPPDLPLLRTPRYAGRTRPRTANIPRYGANW
jgi:hypothetical protein